MKTIGLAVLAISTLTFAQTGQQTSGVQTQIVQHAETVASATPSDMYCSGYITSDKVPDSHYVVGGWNSPDESHFASTTSHIYLYGNGIKEGDRFAIVRKATDPNFYEPIKAQRNIIRSLGEIYFERGYVKVIGVERNVAIAVPELSCTDIVPGDLAIPFVEREKPILRNIPVDRFANTNGKTIGRIVLSNEFDTILSSRAKAYLDIGADKGLKVGDYLRATRTYDYSYRDPEQGMSSLAVNMEDNQKDPPKLSPALLKELPRRTMGNMVVLHVHPKSATVMIMNSFENIQIGDYVEMMDPSDTSIVNEAVAMPASAPGPNAATTPEASTAAAAAPAARPSAPTITCNASPTSVRMGEIATITCTATSPDSRPVRVKFTTDAGKLTSENNRAMLDTAQTSSGPISVKAIATDDRDMSTSATATVNVEAPPAAPAEAQKVDQLQFKPNSAYVDNRSKAALDDVALRLKQDPGATLVLAGDAEGKESPKLATQRAQNAMNYLTQSKGIDGKRIQVKTGSQLTRTVDVWSVPAGASAPK
ncbi:MAG TPA: OmpA family protein [Candidatus Angelobacter sp.]|nr:OmpA family protein [Candidatus Angelobacter sp.]